MDSTPNLNLPYIMAAQAQKHVTHNEAIRSLDALVHLAVKDRNLTQPPASPTNGDRYLIATNATGPWVGHDDALAAYQDGAWIYYTPREGWLCWVEDENITIAFDGTQWVPISSSSSASVNPAPLVGVNTIADSTNRLSVSSPAILFNHDGGDHQTKINKQSSTDKASLVFQSGYSGRAEIGIFGDDNLQIKVSDDGATWKTALEIDSQTGVVTLPNTSSASSGVDAGAVMYFAMLTPPTGWLKADGTAISRTTYATLFAAIGTAFGVGDGSTTFNLPDLRSEFIRGLDEGRGIDSGRILGSAQSDENKAHHHTSLKILNGAALSGSNSSYDLMAQAGLVSNDVKTSISGGGEARPRNVALLACIKY